MIREGEKPCLLWGHCVPMLAEGVPPPPLYPTLSLCLLSPQTDVLSLKHVSVESQVGGLHHRIWRSMFAMGCWDRVPELDEPECTFQPCEARLVGDDC